MNVTDRPEHFQRETAAATPKETGFPIALVIQIVLAVISYLITKATCKADREYLTELKSRLDGRDGR